MAKNNDAANDEWVAAFEKKNKKVADRVKAIAELLEGTVVDADKFENGNKTAGTRVRKDLMNISKVCKVIRKQVQDQKNSGK